MPTRAQKRTLRREVEPSRILTSTVGSERASRKARRLPVIAASKSAFAFAFGLAGSFGLGLGGGEGITGPCPDLGLGLRGSPGEDRDNWTSCVATTRGIGRCEREM